MRTPEWRVLVADDEPAARRGVRQLLSAHPRFTIVAECRDGAETLAALDRHHPDLIFLDIQMPGIDGFGVIRQRTPERMPLTVFLTAYDEFALQGFEAAALDYLVKPVTEARFQVTISRVTRLLDGQQPLVRDTGIVVTTSRGVVRLALDEIDWIEAADNYVRIWMGERHLLLRESLQRLETRLEASGFCRAHRKALVRISAIERLARSRDGGMSAELASGVSIPISRRQRATLRERLRGPRRS